MARLDFCRFNRNRCVSNGSNGLNRTTFQPRPSPLKESQSIFRLDKTRAIVPNCSDLTCTKKYGLTEGPSLGWEINVGYSLSPPVIREFKQIATAGAITAALTEKVWGEYVAPVCQILAKSDTKMSETWTKEFKISYI